MVSWFSLAKCAKKYLWQSGILSKDACQIPASLVKIILTKDTGHWPASLLKMSLFNRSFFTNFTKNKLPGLFKWNIGWNLVNICFEIRFTKNVICFALQII